MILKVTPSAISLGIPDAKPGPAEGCYYVEITDIPEGVLVGQVILLFCDTVRKMADDGKRYEFQFSELRPSSL